MVDHRGAFTNDLDYWAFEAVRIERVATVVLSSTDNEELQESLDRHRQTSPGLREFRNFVTHREDAKRPILT